MFKRGNNFNKKAVTNKWYDFHEIHLKNGKRLDSYDPVNGEIISRKATEFDKIETSTFEKYLKEMDAKYAPGTEIKSNKYPALNGQLLQGQKVLEVPDINSSSSKKAAMEALAAQYNILIRYRPE